MGLIAFVCDRMRWIMRWFKEKFCLFLEWLGKDSGLSNAEAEKRERLIQTYLVVFGLFLSYSADSELQAILMKYFLWFLVPSLIYYSMLTVSFSNRHFLNLMALLMGIDFSVAFACCYGAFYPVGNVLLILIAVVVALPLLV